MACINCEHEVAQGTTHVYFTGGTCEVKQPGVGGFFLKRGGGAAEQERVALLDRVSRLYQEPVLPLSRFCQALKIWGLMAEKRGIIPPGSYQAVSLGIEKSNLLGRIIYGDQLPRTTPCPLHEGRWSGLEHPDNPCPYGCELTGWLREPTFDLKDWNEIYAAVEKLHHRDQDQPTRATRELLARLEAARKKEEPPMTETMTSTDLAKAEQFMSYPHSHEGKGIMPECEGCRQLQEVARLISKGVNVDPPVKLTLDNLVEATERWAISTHDFNREKGWWSKGVRERNVPEIILLARSELIEAHEEYRNPESTLTRVYFGKGGKPEGIPIEIADVAIRCFDTVGAMMREYEISYPRTWMSDPLPPVAENFGEAMDDVIMTLSSVRKVWDQYQRIDRKLAATLLVRGVLVTIHHVFEVANHHKIDLGEAIITKWKYNATRAFRHGNKRS
jgi:hypothetical protein